MSIMILSITVLPILIGELISITKALYVDQQTHTLAQLIFELVMVRDGEWSLSDNSFTKDDITAAIEHLCTVSCPATVLVIVCVDA